MVDFKERYLIKPPTDFTLFFKWKTTFRTIVRLILKNVICFVMLKQSLKHNPLLCFLSVSPMFFLKRGGAYSSAGFARFLQSAVAVNITNSHYIYFPQLIASLFMNIICELCLQLVVTYNRFINGVWDTIKILLFGFCWEISRCHNAIMPRKGPFCFFWADQSFL